MVRLLTCCGVQRRLEVARRRESATRQRDIYCFAALADTIDKVAVADNEGGK